jgi:hypothetical protein
VVFLVFFLRSFSRILLVSAAENLCLEEAQEQILGLRDLSPKSRTDSTPPTKK